MKARYSISLMVLAISLLTISMPAHASTMDDRIESTARQSHVFRTYLKADDIKIQSKDGVVTLTGTVSEESHKSLAGRLWRACQASRLWITDWKSKGSVLPRTLIPGS